MAEYVNEPRWGADASIPVSTRVTACSILTRLVAPSLRCCSCFARRVGHHPVPSAGRHSDQKALPISLFILTNFTAQCCCHRRLSSSAHLKRSQNALTCDTIQRPLQHRSPHSSRCGCSVARASERTPHVVQLALRAKGKLQCALVREAYPLGPDSQPLRQCIAIGWPRKRWSPYTAAIST